MVILSHWSDLMTGRVRMRGAFSDRSLTFACRRDLRFPAAFALVPIALVCVWVANAARVTGMILVGEVSPKTASGSFHSTADGSCRTSWRSPSCSRVGASRSSDASRSDRTSAADRRALPAPAPRDPRDRPRDAPRVRRHGPALSARVPRGGPRALLPPLGPGSIRNGASRHAVFAIWIGVDLLRGGMHGDAAFSAGLASMSGPVRIGWLAFRGYVMRKPIASDLASVPFDRFTWLSSLGSSVLFARFTAGGSPTSPTGMLFAAAALRTGRFSMPSFAHAVANALIAVTVLVTGAVSLWMRGPRSVRSPGNIASEANRHARRRPEPPDGAPARVQRVQPPRRGAHGRRLRAHVVPAVGAGLRPRRLARCVGCGGGNRRDRPLRRDRGIHGRCTLTSDGALGAACALSAKAVRSGRRACSRFSTRVASLTTTPTAPRERPCRRHGRPPGGTTR